MNTLPPFYAFATTNTSDGCGGTPIQRTFGGVTGNIGESCASLKQRVLSKVTPTNTTKLGPPAQPNISRTIRHQRLPPTAATKTAAPVKLDATGTASIGASGAASAEGGASAPASGSVSGADFNIPGLDGIMNSINSALDSAGIPRDTMGFPTVYLIGGGLVILLLALVIKR